MKISNWQKESIIDYPGKISSIVFTLGCNYKCPTCHNPELFYSKNIINKKEIFNYLDSRKDWIDGVVISGGEPTLQFGLKNFVKKIKEKGLEVKLDTNGKNYEVLEELRKNNLIDYVAMDVKCSLSLYSKLIGKEYVDEREDVGKGIGIVSHFPDYEYRTTIVPFFENEKLRWMTPEEVGETAEMIYNWTGIKEHKYFLQGFVSRDKGEILDDKFAKENLPKEFHETPKEHLEECLEEAKKYLPNCSIR